MAPNLRDQPTIYLMKHAYLERLGGPSSSPSATYQPVVTTSKLAQVIYFCTANTPHLPGRMSFASFVKLER